MTITITEVNEPPVVTGMDAVTFAEVIGDIADADLALHTYNEASDPEDNVGSTWSVAGRRQ